MSHGWARISTETQKFNLLARYARRNLNYPNYNRYTWFINNPLGSVKFRAVQWSKPKPQKDVLSAGDDTNHWRAQICTEPRNISVYQCGQWELMPHGRARIDTKTRSIYSPCSLRSQKSQLSQLHQIHLVYKQTPWFSEVSCCSVVKTKTTERCLSAGDDTNHWRARISTETRSIYSPCSLRSRNLIKSYKLVNSFKVLRNKLPPFAFSSYAYAMTNHRFAIKAHRIFSK